MIIIIITYWKRGNVLYSTCVSVESSSLGQVFGLSSEIKEM